MYTEDELEKLWDKYLSNNLEVKKSERKHDDLLYGSGRVPKLLGYAAGFKIVEKYYQNNPYSAKPTFSLSAKKFLSAEHVQAKKSRKK